MSPLVKILSPVLEPAPSYAHVVASAVTRNLRTPAMEKDLLLSMPYPLLPLDQWDPNLDFLDILALFRVKESGLIEPGKNHLTGFFVDNRNLRIFKDPLPGRVKPTAQRLRSNRSHKDDCRKIPGLYSNNSKQRYSPNCSTKQPITTLERSHSPGKNSCSDLNLNPRLFIFYAVLRQARLSRERLQDYKP
ncbi:hypothetical protein QYF36_015179 [Acer negundo]|nr:hypothetical protein QYF36_023183 [Acer negundo]KAK4838624.1 hypothetical protein QYF36_015179 [Acer negundo]